ncbi:MAG: roadblock/LC7 domain-containing protein [Actinomycetota bacterium]|nr:roadblock/LC7 domain-containing protein [Actinomycetota bacterium]
MTRPPGPAEDLGGLLSGFATRIDGIRHALIVSSDGLLVGLSAGLPRDVADQFAAVTSGLASLTGGAAGCFGFEGMRQVVVEMAEGYLFVSAIVHGACLAVIAERTCDMGLVGYEMTMLADSCARTLTPELMSHLRHTLPR